MKSLMSPFFKLVLLICLNSLLYCQRKQSPTPPHEVKPSVASNNEQNSQKKEESLAESDRLSIFGQLDRIDKSYMKQELLSMQDQSLVEKFGTVDSFDTPALKILANKIDSYNYEELLKKQSALFGKPIIIEGIVTDIVEKDNATVIKLLAGRHYWPGGIHTHFYYILGRFLTTFVRHNRIEAVGYLAKPAWQEENEGYIPFVAAAAIVKPGGIKALNFTYLKGRSLIK